MTPESPGEGQGMQRMTCSVQCGHRTVCSRADGGFFAFIEVFLHQKPKIPPKETRSAASPMPYRHHNVQAPNQRGEVEDDQLP